MSYTKKQKKYILKLIISIVIVITAIAVYQRGAIMDLKKQITGEDLSAHKEVAKNNPSTVRAVQMAIEEGIKELKGAIVSKNGNILGIEADVVDFSKLSGLTEEELQQSISTFPKTKKKFEVSVSDKTQLAPTKLENLSEGTMIIVESSDPVYKNDRFTASKISLAGDDPALAGASIESQLENQIKQSKYIAGKIKEVGDNYFIVDASVVDVSKINNFEKMDARTAPQKIKEYKVYIDDNTLFVDKNRNELKAGSWSIRADSLVPVYSISEFTATRIEAKTDCESK